MIQFEKVSKGQFLKDIEKHQQVNLEEPTIKSHMEFAYDIFVSPPKRATSGSAGYDFVSPISVCINPGQKIVVPTGIRARMAKEKVLLIVPRSSLGFKYQIGLANTIGVIDSDYYFGDNEGHIMIALENRGQEQVLIEAGDRFAQGLFVSYFTTDDDDAIGERTGGMGSTGK